VDRDRRAARRLRNAAGLLALTLAAACSPPPTDIIGEKLREVRCEGTALGAVVRYEFYLHAMESWTYGRVERDGAPLASGAVTTTTFDRKDAWEVDGWRMFLWEDPLRISVDDPEGRREFVRICLEM
jgi:hypothetical protein